MRKLIKVTMVEEFPLYDISVKNDHCFELANGVLAHNSMYSSDVQSGGCLISGTEVVLEDGRLIPIDDVVVGDILMSKDGPTKVLNTWNPETLENGTPNCYEIIFEDESVVTCSENHRFMKDGDWVEAKTLVVGDDLHTSEEVPNKSIKEIREVGPRDVFDVETECSHYLLANGIVSHNSGAIYAASSVLTLSKAKEKDLSTNETTGVIITITATKSRLTKENTKIKCLVKYDGGLSRYYGLLELAEAAGIFKKISTRYELEDGTKVFGKAINENPEKYYTPAALEKINEYIKKVFSYGASSEKPFDVEEDVIRNAEPTESNDE